MLDVTIPIKAILPAMRACEYRIRNALETYTIFYLQCMPMRTVKAAVALD
jgi:hypothetical protein